MAGEPPELRPTVPSFDNLGVAEVIDSPAIDLAPGSKELDPWGSIITIGLPEGVIRHPVMIDIVSKHLGRLCAIDTRDEGIRVGFTALGTSQEEADEDSRFVARHLLGLLGLPETTIVSRLLCRREVHELVERPKLRLLTPDD